MNNSGPTRHGVPRPPNSYTTSWDATYLHEAATVLISRLQRPCALGAWARALAERIGTKKARVALARKLAVLLRHLWSHAEDFRWASA